MAANKTKEDVSRWLMKNRSGSATASPSKASSTTVSPHGSPKAKERLVHRLMASEEARKAGQMRAQLMSRTHRQGEAAREDLDFDEIFDDDEGIEALEGEGADERAASLKNYKLSSEGRQMKRIVKHLDKDNDIIYASDDEMDPYGEGDEDDDDDLEGATNEAQRKDEGNFDKLADRVQPAPPSKGATPAASKATSPAGSPQKKPPTSASSNAKKAKTVAPVVPDNSITEGELIGYLKQGPLSTKDLIAKFKRQLKADAKNKDVFRELVRRVAMVGGGGSGEEDRLLELKPEYK